MPEAIDSSWISSLQEPVKQIWVDIFFHYQTNKD